MTDATSGTCNAAVMAEPFIGSEAIAAGDLTKAQISTRCSRFFPDVYIERDVGVTTELRVKAGWLWTGRRGGGAGFSGAALHGSKWVEAGPSLGLVPANRPR